MKRNEVLAAISWMVEFLCLTAIEDVENTFLRISLAIAIVCVSISLLLLSFSYFKSRDISK